MAENDVPKPPRRKVDMDNWAKNDITPALPSPGQAIRQKKGKQD
ncbi:MAG: hypothetical protein WC717_02155 [Candidatus Micrarchaeia archaeon]|jgi:hypothetical protein